MLSILRKYPALTKFLNWTYQRVRPTGITLIQARGVKMYVDWAQDPALLLFGEYSEAYETELFEGILRKNSVVADVGSNNGWYALMAAKIAIHGKVFAFEPEPTAFELLKRNVEVNSFNNVETIQKAVSNKDGKTQIYISKGWSATSLAEKNVPIGKRDNVTQIDTVTLDGFLKDQYVDVLIIDVEGAEGLVLEGAERTINNRDLRIFLEYSPQLLRNMGTDPNLFLEKMLEKGFKICIIDEKERSVSVVSPEQATREASRHSANHVNLLIERK